MMLNAGNEFGCHPTSSFKPLNASESVLSESSHPHTLKELKALSPSGILKPDRFPTGIIFFLKNSSYSINARYGRAIYQWQNSHYFLPYFLQGPRVTCSYQMIQGNFKPFKSL